nr:MAG TPA: hypothetical protein [Caudoviricetes sp.]
MPLRRGVMFFCVTLHNTCPSNLLGRWDTLFI